MFVRTKLISITAIALLVFGATITTAAAAEHGKKKTAQASKSVPRSSSPSRQLGTTGSPSPQEKSGFTTY
jgi:hypothetical protein